MSAGAKDWFRQRVAAVLLVPLSLWLLWAGASLAGASHAEAGAFFGHPVNAIAAVLLAVIGLYHTQAGAQNVIEDYAPGKTFQGILIFLSRAMCLAGGLVVLWAVSRFLFGA